MTGGLGGPAIRRGLCAWHSRDALPRDPAWHVWKPSQPPLSLIPALLCVLFMFYRRGTFMERVNLEKV